MPSRTTVIITQIIYIMAKNTKSKNSAKRRRIVQVRRPVMRVENTMSRREQEYKRLLLDPCNAELTASPYGGDAAALVQRTHKVFNNTSTAMLVLYHPILGEYIVDGVGLQNIRPLNGVSQISSGTARGIAGCLEAIYTGAENARSGTVQCSVLPGAIVWTYLSIALGGAGSQMDLVNVAARFQNISRMPVERCAVNWFPGDGDTDFIPPITLNSQQGGATEKIFASTHFCAIYISGVANNDVRFSTTSVYEANAVSATAVGSLDVLPWAIQSKTTPPVDIPKVIRGLSSVDTRWYLNAFKKVAKFGVGLVDSTLRGGLPGALGYLTNEMSTAYDTTYGGPKGRVVRSGN